MRSKPALLTVLLLVTVLALDACDGGEEGDPYTIEEPTDRDPGEAEPDAEESPEAADTAVQPLVEQRSIEDSTEEGGGSLLTVTDVRIGTHQGFDRVVFEIAGEGPAGWLVHYVDQPVMQGRGAPVDIEGQAFLEVVIRGVALPPDAPDHDPWDGERLAVPEGAQVVELVDDSIFEGQHVFHIGLREQAAFGVVRLDDPQRIVIEIDQP